MLLPQWEQGRGTFTKARRDGILWRARLLDHPKDGDRESLGCREGLGQPAPVGGVPAHGSAPFQPKSFHDSAPYKQMSALLGTTPTRMLILHGPNGSADAETSQQGSTSWGNPAPIQPGKHSQQPGKSEGNERRHLSSSVSHLPAHHFPSHPAPAVPRSIRMSHRGM